MKKLLFSLAGTYALYRFFRAGWVDSMDFTVYWKAAQTWVIGSASPYAYDEATRGFVFKYPPWILPIFLPFGFLSFETSKILWVIIELACLGYSIRWLRLAGVRPGILALTFAMFWWIWLAHFFAGQFTLAILAMSLWAIPPRGEASCTYPGRLGALAFILTAKVFSLITLLGVARCYVRPRTLLWAFASLLTSNIILLVVSPKLGAMYQEWIQAATSGGQELGALVVRGQMNHGFTAGILRWLDVPATNTRADLVTSLGLAVLFSSVWFWASSNLRLQERWAGWLAVGLICHPLAWHHSFVLAFPICALAINGAKSRVLLALSILATCFIGIFLPEILGATLVTPLEIMSSKSWGVCLAAWVLTLNARHLQLPEPEAPTHGRDRSSQDRPRQAPRSL